MSYTKEKGIVRKGQAYRLERYPDDNIIPGRLPAVDDLSNLAELFEQTLDGVVAAAGGVVDTVNATVTSGPNTIRSRNTAELAFDGATAPFSEESASRRSPSSR